MKHSLHNLLHLAFGTLGAKIAPSIIIPTQKSIVADKIKDATRDVSERTEDIADKLRTLKFMSETMGQRGRR